MIEKKVISVYIKALVPLTLILVLGIFVCTVAAALSRGVARLVFGLLVLALYASSLMGYTIITEYMQHNMGIGKWQSFLICLVAMLAMMYLSLKIRHALLQNYRDVRKISRSYRVY